MLFWEIQTDLIICKRFVAFLGNAFPLRSNMILGLYALEFILQSAGGYGAGCRQHSATQHHCKDQMEVELTITIFRFDRMSYNE